MNNRDDRHGVRVFLLFTLALSSVFYFLIVKSGHVGGGGGGLCRGLDVVPWPRGATTRLLGSFPVRCGPTGRFLFPDQSTYSRNLPSFDQSGGALLFGVSSAICRHPGSSTTPYSGDRRPHGWTRKSSVAGHAQNNGSGGCDDLWIGLGFETLQVRMC